MRDGNAAEVVLRQTTALDTAGPGCIDLIDFIPGCYEFKSMAMQLGSIGLGKPNGVQGSCAGGGEMLSSGLHE